MLAHKAEHEGVICIEASRYAAKEVEALETRG
jgi:hypothetical protein